MMYVPCDCGNKTFYIKVDFGEGLLGIAECTECGREQEIGTEA